MKRLLAVLMLLTLAASSQAAPGGCGWGTYLSSIDSEQLTVSSTALPFTAAKYSRGGAIPMLAVVAVQTNGIRTLDSGLNPTASVGMPWAAASTFSVCGESNIRAFRMIRQTSDAVVDISYYKEGN